MSSCRATNAKAEGATHLIVVCDTFDHEDYAAKLRAALEDA